MEYQVKKLVSQQAVLAEGPVWNADSNAIYYVDISGKKLHRYALHRQKLDTLSLSEMPGCLVPVTEGGYLAAAQNKLLLVDENLLSVKSLITSLNPEPLRFNDGKCDAAGRLWAGTMWMDQAHPSAKGGGALYRIEAGRATAVLRDMTIPNGLAWRADNRVFYHADSDRHCIDRYDFDLETGAIGNRRTVITIGQEDCVPDGLCIDEAGMLWVAIWGGFCVVRYNPEIGSEIGRIALPAKYVTCCTFGGAEMNTLFITTAMDEQGNGGEVYAAKVDATGPLPFPYRLESD